MKTFIIEKCMNCGKEFKILLEDFEALPNFILGEDSSTFPIPVAKKIHICDIDNFWFDGERKLCTTKGLIEVVGCIEEEGEDES